MTTENQTPLHVVELRAENIKRLQAVTVRPDGELVIIGGRNAQGKSSLLDALEMALGGKNAIPAEPVRRGARKGRIVVDLGDIVVERTFSAKGSQLVVKNAEGVVQKSPQRLLDALCSKIAFDPLDFARMEAKRQDSTLKEVLKLDFSALDARRQADFDKRRDIKRDIKRLEAQLDGMPLQVAPVEEVSVAELSRQLEDMHDQELENRNVQQRAEMADDAADDAWNCVAGARRAVRRLERDLFDAREQLIDVRDEAVRAEEVLAHEDARAVALVWPNPDPIREQIATAEETNARVRANRERGKLDNQARALVKQADDLSDRIIAVDDEKASQLEQAEFPVPGLGFDECGPTLNDIPLEQCSQAERLRLSVAIGAALNPRLKVMLIREAALLDSDSMELLAKLAEETGSQLWLERVGDQDASAVIIEDGMVRSAEEVAAE